MGKTLADLLDGVRWDFDPAQRSLSPLVATARWFEDFPWNGEGTEGEDGDTAVPLSPEGRA